MRPVLANTLSRIAIKKRHAQKHTIKNFDLAQFVSRSYAGLEEDLNTHRSSNVRRNAPYGRERVAPYGRERVALERAGGTGQLYLQALVLSSYFEDT